MKNLKKAQHLQGRCSAYDGKFRYGLKIQWKISNRFENNTVIWGTYLMPRILQCPIRKAKILTDKPVFMVR